MQDRPEKQLPAGVVSKRAEQPSAARARSSSMRSTATAVWARRRALAALAVAAALAFYFGGPLVLGPQVLVEQAVRADFIQSVVASGHVEAPFRVDVGTQITGIVADVPVTEGQYVNAGEVLIALDDREARSAVLQAEGVAAQTEARMRQLRELTLPSAEQALRQAQATLLNAQKIYDRAAKLAGDGFASRAALDEATKNLDIAQTQVRSAEYQVFTSKPGGSDYVMAETQLNQARAALATVQSRLSYTVVRAPRDGILISRDVERGNVVQPGRLLMRLSPVGETQLVVQIDEKNLALIAVGQQALASADAYPKSTFPAEVVFINPGVDLQRASVEVKLRVPSPPPYLRQDMTVSVDIEVARRPGAVVLPVSSVRDASSDRPWVMKIEDGHAKRQPVQLGIVSGGKAEIVSGLEPETQAVPTGNSKIKEGQRVRTIAQVSNRQ